MAQNAAAFEEYLGKQQIVLEKNSHEDNTLYVIRENLDEVGPVALMALFNDSDRYVTLICYKYLPFAPEKKAALLELINSFNAEYTLVKFMATGDAVSVQIVIPFHDNYSSEVVIDMISLLFRSIKEEHPRLLQVLQA